MADNQNPQHLDDELLDQELPEGADDDGKPASRGWLGWVVSGTIHTSVLIVFATWIISNVVQGEKETPPVRVSTIAPIKEPEKPKEKKLEEKKPMLEKLSEVSDVPTPVSAVDLPVDKSMTEDESDQNTRKGREEATADSEQGGQGAFMAIGAGGGASGMFGNRNGGGRKRAVARFGGSPGSEGAVDEGLRWLKRHQEKASGSWNAVTYPLNCEEDPKCEKGENEDGNTEVAMTGYALLCFLGAGFDHRVQTEYKPVVRKGIDWLLAHQGPDGRFNKSRNYEHPIASMALFEAYGMTKDPDLREPCEKALKVILDCQAKDPAAADKSYNRLAWGYTFPEPTRNDSSSSGWNVMALKSALAADLTEAKAGLEGAKVWLERAWKATNRGKMPADIYGESAFPYTWNAPSDTVEYAGANNKYRDLTPVGFVCSVFLGHESGDLMLETMANHAMKYQKPTSWATYNSYYTYYNTMGMFQLGGKKWEEWNSTVRDFIVEAQRKDDGCFKGSWDWDKGVRWHGSGVGRVLSTCYGILNLQVYYRYDQVHKKK